MRNLINTSVLAMAAISGSPQVAESTTTYNNPFTKEPQPQFNDEERNAVTLWRKNKFKMNASKEAKRNRK